MIRGCVLVTLLIGIMSKIFGQQPGYFSISDQSHLDAAVNIEKVISTKDGGTLIVGTSYWNSWQKSSALLIKTDSQGLISWSRMYDYDESLQFHTACEHTNGYYVGGETLFSQASLVDIDTSGNVNSCRIFNSGSITGFAKFQNKILAISHGFIFKIDDAENISAFSQYERTFLDSIREIVADDSCIYLLGFYNYDVSGCYEKSKLVKKNANGEIVWSKDNIKLQGSGSTELVSGYLNSDHTLTGLFRCNSTFCDVGKIAFAHFDSSGNVLSTKVFSTGGFESWTRKFSISTDSSVLAFDFVSGDTGTLVIQFDKYENTVWNKKYFPSTYDDPIAGTKTKDGWITVAGNTGSTVKGFIMTLSPVGDGCNSVDYIVNTGNNNIQMDDRSFSQLSDTTYSYSSASVVVSNDVEIVQVCGLATGNGESSTINEGFLVYPDPFKNNFSISFSSVDIAQLIICNEFGRTISSSFVKNGSRCGDALIPGFYFLKLITPDKKIFITKVFKSR